MYFFPPLIWPLILFDIFQVQGLCGKYNYITSDDWMTPFGITETKASHFVQNYMVPQNCATQLDRPAVLECPQLKVNTAH